MMMDFEADRMRNLILTDDGRSTPSATSSWRSAARASTTIPTRCSTRRSTPTLYQNHPYRIPVIGWMQEMEQLNRADALAFYDRYYAPNNAMLVVAGDVDAADGHAPGRGDLRQGAARAGAAAAHAPARAASRTPSAR